jgi:hypothetical protein
MHNSMDTGLVMTTATNIEASLASTGIKIATGGGAVSVIAFISSAQFVAIIGILTAILGFAITWWYKRRDSLLIKRESEERILLQRQETEQRMKIETERLEMDKEEHSLQIQLLKSQLNNDIVIS